MEGTPFGRYRLLKLLGRGGMGEVWRAYDTETRRVVAIKVLPANLANDPAFEDRFRREAFAAAGLSEPHVVPIHNFGEIDGRLYVDMRLIDGRDLGVLIAAGPLEPARAVHIIEQIAAALSEAHRIGLVHRDVKPSNILVTDNDFAYLIDFGIARAAGQTALTGTGNFVGTMAYVAPERITAGLVDPRCDTYALTCVFYECLTGYQPFPGDSIEQQIGAHLTLPPPRPSVARTGLTGDFDGVIASGMAKDPDERYGNVNDLAAAARAAVTETHVLPQHSTVAATLSDRGTEVAGTVAAPVAAQGPPVGGSGADSKRRKLLMAGAVALVATIGIVIAIAVFPTGPSKSAQPSPNTGPFTGSYTVDFGKAASARGKEFADTSPSRETWKMRSACGAAGCVATATADDGQFMPTSPWIFDNLDDRWLAAGFTLAECAGGRQERFVHMWLEPQPDGTLTGEWASEGKTTDGVNCYSKRPVVFTRSGDVDTAPLADPAAQPARIASPALGLHGRYHSVRQLHAVDGTTRSETVEDDFDIDTVCLRTGDRCLSRFVFPDGSGRMSLAFANSAWTRNDQFDSTCEKGGTAHSKVEGVYPLPVPAQDPITTLSGRAHQQIIGETPCESLDYEEVFTRSGD